MKREAAGGPVDETEDRAAGTHVHVLSLMLELVVCGCLLITKTALCKGPRLHLPSLS